nr:hypothetical protein [Brucella anthropi]
MKSFTATQGITISGDSCGTEIELTVQIKFSVSKYRPATTIDPAEDATIEINGISFFDGKQELNLTYWLEDRLSESDSLKAWLMSEANEQSLQAQEDHADYMREMRRESDHA